MTELSTYTNLLLDTGNRNNYLYFDDDHSMTADLTGASPEVLVRRMTRGKVIDIYRPSTTGVLSDEDDAERISRGEKLILAGSYRVSISAVRNMMTRDNACCDETGIHVMHLSIGMVQWRNDEISYHWNLAPLLMVPVSVYRNASSRSYSIRIEGRAPYLNPAFSFKARSEFGITLPEYKDEAFFTWINRITEALQPLGWKLKNRCTLALYQDHFLNIYNDLSVHKDLVLRHPVIRKFLAADSDAGSRGVTGGTDFSGQADTAGDTVSDDALHCVIDADASQLRAIRMARAGRSFVVQGPPGTGKSQTITNIIAECLYNGKRVLFVSAKRAALDFVYGKLSSAGLNDYCLRIHGTRENRRVVTGDIFRSLQLPRATARPQAEFDISRRAAAAKTLDTYVSELHKVRPVIGKPLYELYELYFQYEDAPELSWQIPNVYSLSEEDLQENLRYLTWYTNCIPMIGYDYKTCYWYGFTAEDNSPEFREQVINSFRAAVKWIDSDLALVKEVHQYLSYLPVETLEDLESTKQTVEEIASTSEISPSLFREGTLDYALREISQLKASAAKLDSYRATVEMEYKPSIYSINAAQDYTLLKDRFHSRLRRAGSREYRRIMNELQAASPTDERPDYDSALKILDSLKQIQDAEEALKQQALPFETIYGMLPDVTHTDWDDIEKKLVDLSNLLHRIPRLTELSGVTSAQFMALRQLCVRWSEGFRRNQEDSEADMEFISYCVKDGLKPMQMPVRRLREWLQGCIDHADQYGTWIHFLNVRDCLNERNLTGFIDAAIAALIPAEQFNNMYCRLFYSQWINSIVASSPVLAGFSRAGQDKARETYCAEDRILFDINRKAIREKLSAGRPSLKNAAPGEPVTELLREIQKSENPKSVRRIITDYAELIQQIMPCFMMSPMSVSTYLDPERIHFDTVVFDEASQLLPQESFGAIYRSTQVIIVGDSQQMPPRDPKVRAESTDPGKGSPEQLPASDMPGADSTGDDRLSEGDPDGGEWLYNPGRRTARRNDLYARVPFESVLDLGCASLYQMRLLWHYRSQKEGLILFSNRLLYHDTLITFPSPDTDLTVSSFGIDYRYTESFYDPDTNTNLKEASAVVSLIFDCIRQYPGRSIGVVATTHEQEALIAKLLIRRREQDPSAKHFFTEETAEPFFIKNMETVQGDERDIIIASCVYGKTLRGELPLDFGAISQTGGERRLNVMITRARCSMKVVTGLHAGDLEVWKNPPEGVRLFHDYLNYAEQGPGVLGGAATMETDNPYDTYMEDEICQLLEQNGFSTKQHVGYSMSKIDVAVRMPGENHYFLAIECDGDTYRRGENTRDRERLRREVLERMGWKYYRVWSAEWYLHHSAEVKNLLTAVRKAAGLPKHPLAKRAAATAAARAAAAAEKATEKAAAEKAAEKAAETAAEKEKSEAASENSGTGNRTRNTSPVRAWMPPHDRY